MLIYCKKCQCLIEKIDEVMHDGHTIVKVCPDCKTRQSFYIKYKAKSTVIDNKG